MWKSLPALFAIAQSYCGCTRTSDSFQSIEPCEVDINGNLKDYGYTLEVQYLALTWMDLVNFFEFDWMLYMVLFIVVG